MTSDNSSRIIACAIAPNLEAFDQVIEQMQSTFGENWGGLNIEDALPVLSSRHAEQMDHVLVAFDKGDDVQLSEIQGIITAAKGRDLTVTLVTSGLPAETLQELMRSDADDFLPYPLPDGALAATFAKLEKAAAPEPAAEPPMEAAEANPAPQETAVEKAIDPLEQKLDEAFSDGVPDERSSLGVAAGATSVVGSAISGLMGRSKSEKKVEEVEEEAAKVAAELKQAQTQAEPATQPAAQPAPQPAPAPAAEPEPAVAQPAPAVAQPAPVAASAAQPAAAAAAAAVAQPTLVETQPAAPAPQPAPTPQPVVAGGGRNGILLPVYGLAGGVGTSTFAANLAWELQSIAGKDETRVCIIDFGFQFGSVATYLDVGRSDVSLEFLSSVSGLDAQAFSQSTPKYKNRLAVLPAPIDAVPLEVADPEEIGMLLDLAVSMYDYVIVDLPTALVSWSETVLNRSKLYLAVGEVEMRSAQNALRFLRVLKADDLPYEKVQFIINRAPKKTDLNGRSRMKRMSESLNVEFRWLLPDGGKQVLTACDQGTPLAEVAGRNPLRKEIRKIAENLVELSKEPANEKARA